MWNDLDFSISCAALWTESAMPLPDVLFEEFLNAEALSTITDNPPLFKIVTPINVTHFKELLVTHPKPLFVNSGCACVGNF
jgi:hypothetical protein